MIFISAISLGTFVLYIRIQPQCCFRSSFTEKIENIVCSICRWGRHRKRSAQDGAASVHGV
jgi:hypothetical protein